MKLPPFKVCVGLVMLGTLAVLTIAIVKVRRLLGIGTKHLNSTRG